MPLTLKLITYCLGRDEGVYNVLKCFDGFCGVINLPHTDNIFNVINICHSKHRRIITGSLGKVKMMLRVKITDSSTTETCLVTYLSFRKTRVKQSNNIKGFSRNWLLLGGMRWLSKIPPTID